MFSSDGEEAQNDDEISKLVTTVVLDTVIHSHAHMYNYAFGRTAIKNRISQTLKSQEG